MSDFKTKMHQIRFRLGLRLQTPLGELTALPRPLAGFGALYILRGVGGQGMGGEGRGRGEGIKGKGKEGKGRGGA